MPQYFVRLRNGDRLIPDDGEGQEFASLAAVRHEVDESARQILSDAVLRGKAGRLNVQIEVIDENNRTVLTVPVGYVTGTETQT